MKSRIYQISAISFFLLPLCTFANILEWKDNIPSSLAPFQNNSTELASLAKDQILIYAHPTTNTYIPTQKKNPNPKANFTSAAIVLPVSEETLIKTLSQYENYVGLFPTLKSVKVLDKKQNVSQVQYKISIPTPIPALNFNETIVFQHQLEDNSLSSLVIDAPVPYGIGKFEWFKVDNNKTLLTLTQWGDLNQPKGYIFSKILNSIPEAKLGIPAGTNGFILESLRKKFSSIPPYALKAGQFPPDPFSQAQLQRLVQVSRSSESPVSVIHWAATVPYEHGAESMRFVTTYNYVNQPIQKLQKWLQPIHYKKLFPKQLKSIDVQPLPANQQLAHFKVGLSLGVINIPFNFKLNYSYPQSNQNLFSAQGGDLKFIKGNMQLETAQNGTLMKITAATKIDAKAPFLIRAARSLPYHDLLPTLGANTVFAIKIKNEEDR